MTFAAVLAQADRVLLGRVGEPLVYRAGYGEPREVTGIFETPYQQLEVGEAGIESAAPAVWFRLADLPTDPEVDKRGARIERGADTYRIAEVEKDGFGGVRLRLHRA